MHAKASALNNRQGCDPNRQLQLLNNVIEESPGVKNLFPAPARSANKGGSDQSISGGEGRFFLTAAAGGTLSHRKRQPAVRPTPGRRLNHNVNIPAQSSKAFQ